MSLFAYNGVSLPYAHSVQFRQEPQYDDLSSTDWYCTRFDIQVESLLNTDYISVIDPTISSATNAADVMNQIRVKLLQPRRMLTYSFNGVNVIPSLSQNGQPGTVDVQNGPKPQSCNITQLTTTTFLINYHIIAHYWENISTNHSLSTVSAGNNVLYNRWSETVEIDQSGYTKQKVREGKFIIRSDNVDGKAADQITTQMAVVSVPKGFLRESSHYTITPDGLGIQYRLVDKEVFKLPPAPAFESSGEYVDTSTRYGAVRWGEVRVKLRGSKNTIQTDLILAAMQVCARKLQISGAKRPTDGSKSFGMLEMMVLTVDLYDNSVECRMRAMLEPLKNIFTGVAGQNDLKNVANTPNSDGASYTPPVLDFGSANLLLKAAAYYDPTLKNTKINPSTGQLTVGLNVGQAGKSKEP